MSGNIIFHPALCETLVKSGALFDGGFVTLDVTNPVFSQVGTNKLTMALAISGGLILGAPDVASYVEYDGKFIRQFFERKRKKHIPHGFETIPEEPIAPKTNSGFSFSRCYQSVKSALSCVASPIASTLKAINTTCFPLLGPLKDAAEAYFSLSGLAAFIQEWSQTDEEESFVTPLEALSPSTLVIMAAVYLVIKLPLFLTAEFQETYNELNGVEKKSFLHRIRGIETHIKFVAPAGNALLNSIPQLVFFSPNTIKTMAASHWTRIPLVLNGLSWLWNLHTTYRRIHNQDIPTAMANLGVACPEHTDNIGTWSNLNWIIAQTIERDLAFSQAIPTKGPLTTSIKIIGGALIALVPVTGLAIAASQTRETEEDLTTASVKPPRTVTPIERASQSFSPSANSPSVENDIL